MLTCPVNTRQLHVHIHTQEKGRADRCPMQRRGMPSPQTPRTLPHSRPLPHSRQPLCTYKNHPKTEYRHLLVLQVVTSCIRGTRNATIEFHSGTMARLPLMSTWATNTRSSTEVSTRRATSMPVFCLPITNPEHYAARTAVAVRFVSARFW